MAVVAKYPDFLNIESYQIYKIDADNGSINKVSSNEDPQPIVMNEFDYVLTEKNYTTPIIIRIVVGHVVETKNGITIDMSTENNLGETTPITNYASNICSIRAKYGNIYNNGVAIYDDEFEEMEDVFSEFENDSSIVYNSFLEVERNENEFANHKVLEKTITLGSFSNYVYEENDTKKIVFYLELTYNADLINEYNEQNAGALDSFEDLENNVPFTYDLNSFILGYVSWNRWEEIWH